MNLDDLASLIQRNVHIDSEPSEEDQENTIKGLQRYKDEYPHEFFNQLIQLLQTETNIELVNDYTIFLYSSIKHIPALTSSDSISQTFEVIKDIYTALISSTEVRTDIKRNFSYVLGYVIGQFSQEFPENTAPQELILSILQTDDVEAECGILALVEMLQTTSSMFSFSEDNIVEILQMNADRIILFKLLIESAKIIPESEQFHNLFIEFLSSMTESELSEAFNVLTNFAETSSKFFEPHLNDFIPFVCEHIENGDDNTKRRGIYLLQEMAEKESSMCSKSETYINSVIATLIKVMANTVSLTSVVFDCMDESPYTVAWEAYEDINSLIASSNQFNTFSQMMIETVQEDIDEDMHIALMVAIAKTSPLTMSTIAEANPELSEEENNAEIASKVSDFCSVVFNVICDNSFSDRMRYAAFKASENMCNCLYGIYQKACPEEIIEGIVDSIQGSEDTQVRLAAIDSLIAFIDRPLSDEAIAQQLEELFEIIVHTTEECDDDLVLPHLIKLMTKIVKQSSSEKIAPLVENIVEICDTIYTQTDDTTKADMFALLSTSIERFDRDSLSEATQTLIVTFFEYICESKATDGGIMSDPEVSSLVESSFRIFMSKMPIDELLEYIPNIVDPCLQQLGEYSQIQETSIYDDMPDSSMVHLESNKPGSRFFIEKSQIETYCENFATLRYVLRSIGADFVVQYFEPIVEVLKTHLTSNIFVDSIARDAFALMIEMGSYTPQEMIPQYSEVSKELAIGYFSQNLMPSNIKDSLIMLMELGRNWFSTLITSSFPPYYQMIKGRNQQTNLTFSDEFPSKYTTLIMKIVGLLLPKLLDEMLKSTDSEGDSVELSDINDSLSVLISIFKDSAIISPEVVREICEAELMPKISKALDNERTHNIGLKFFFVYATTSTDMETLKGDPFQAVIQELQAAVPENVYSAFNYIMYLFLSRFNNLLPEAYTFHANICRNSFMLPYINDSEFDFAHDRLVLAATVIIWNEFTEFVESDLLNSWFEALPLRTQCNEGDLVYSLLAKAIFSETSVVCEGDAVLHLIHVIVTAIRCHHFTVSCTRCLQIVLFRFLDNDEDALELFKECIEDEGEFSPDDLSIIRGLDALLSVYRSSEAHDDQELPPYLFV